jgi:hypothetical protein
VTAQYPVELCTQALNSTATLVIEKVSAKFDRDAVQDLERMRQQQKFALCVDRGPLHALAVPRSPDLNSSIDSVDIKIVGPAHSFASCSADNCER